MFYPANTPRMLLGSFGHTKGEQKLMIFKGGACFSMLILFLRAVLMYALVFAVLRLTGKRQVADLQPFDLLITLMVADLASCAIADTGIPLAYSVVPILALYLVQQVVNYLSLKSAGMRRLFCGSPLILIRGGILQEDMMRAANYTVLDLLDQLRAKDIFDLGNVSYAILETNGSLSVLQKGDCQTPTLSDLNLKAPEPCGLAYMLVLDGVLCESAMQTCGVSEDWVRSRLRQAGVVRPQDVFYAQLTPDGTLLVQTRQSLGARQTAIPTEVKLGAL